MCNILNILSLVLIYLVEALLRPLSWMFLNIGRDLHGFAYQFARLGLWLAKRSRWLAIRRQNQVYDMCGAAEEERDVFDASDHLPVGMSEEEDPITPTTYLTQNDSPSHPVSPLSWEMESDSESDENAEMIEDGYDEAITHHLFRN